ncbi:hypothetical protein HDU93_001583 [Gonapodya sp. JEL0774]|nr:hypothetical protein HDU93_001583 [Gonapodya sp. JEL0774]
MPSPLGHRNVSKVLGDATQRLASPAPKKGAGPPMFDKKRKAESDVENHIQQADPLTKVGVPIGREQPRKKRIKHTEVRVLNGVLYDPVNGGALIRAVVMNLHSSTHGLNNYDFPVSCTKMVSSGGKKNPTQRRCGAYYHIGSKCLLGRYGEDGEAIMSLLIPNGDGRRKGHCSYEEEEYVWEVRSLRPGRSVRDNVAQAPTFLNAVSRVQGSLHLPPTGIMSIYARKSGTSVASLLASDPTLTTHSFPRTPKSPKVSKDKGDREMDVVVELDIGKGKQKAQGGEATRSVLSGSSAISKPLGPSKKPSKFAISTGENSLPIDPTTDLTKKARKVKQTASEGTVNLPKKVLKPKPAARPKVEPPLPEVTPITIDGVEGEVVGDWLHLREFTRAFGEVFEIPRTTYRAICRQDVPLTVLATLLTDVILIAELEDTKEDNPAEKLNDIIESLDECNQWSIKASGTGVKKKELLLYEPLKSARHREKVREVERCLEVSVRGGTKERLRSVCLILDWIIQNSEIAQNAVEEAAKSISVQKSVHFQRTVQHRRLMNLADVDRRTRLIMAEPVTEKNAEQRKQADKQWDKERKDELERCGPIEEWLAITANPKLGGLLRSGDFLGRDSKGNEYWAFGAGEDGTFEGETCNGKKKWRCWINGVLWWDDERRKLSLQNAPSATAADVSADSDSESSTGWYVVSAYRPDMREGATMKSEVERLADWLEWWDERRETSHSEEIIPTSLEVLDTDLPGVVQQKPMSLDIRVVNALRRYAHRALVMELPGKRERIVSEEQIDAALQQAKAKKELELAARREATETKVVPGEAESRDGEPNLLLEEESVHCVTEDGDDEGTEVSLDN